MRNGYCNYFYGCTLAYDADGYCYVVSTNKLETGSEHSLYFSWSLSTDAKTPCRRGYTFAGWATEEGGEVVFEPEFSSGIHQEFPTGHEQYAEYMHTVFDETSPQKAHEKLMDKTLHAVWIPNE